MARSGTIYPEDRVVWVGDPDVIEVGSSFKAREVTRTHVAIDPIHGTYEQRLNDLEWHRRGTEIVSCKEAADRGIETLGCSPSSARTSRLSRQVEGCCQHP